VFYLGGKEAEAEAEFKSAAALNSNAGMYALGRLYYQQHRYPEAIAGIAQRWWRSIP